MPAILGPGSVSLETCASDAQARISGSGRKPDKGLSLIGLLPPRPPNSQVLALEPDGSPAAASHWSSGLAPHLRRR